MGDNHHYHRAQMMSLVQEKIKGATYVLTSTCKMLIDFLLNYCAQQLVSRLGATFHHFCLKS